MSIEDRLSGNETTWRPIIDDTHPQMLIGDIVDIDQGDGDYGVFPILVIRDEKGQEWRWSVFGGVAQGRINKLQPQIGDKIGAKYLGEEPSRNFPNKTYHNWKIVLDRGTGHVMPTPVAPVLPEPPGFDDF